MSTEPSAAGEPSAGTSRRGRWLIWSALLLTVAVLAVALFTDKGRPVGDLTVGDVVRVGAFEGDSIPEYIRSSRAELAGLAGAARSEQVQSYALVTFSTYLTPDQLDAVLSGAAVAEVIVRVPLPEAQTQIVRLPAVRIPADVAAGMARLAERKDGEAGEYQDRAAAADDAELQRVYERGAQVARAEADAYRRHCACIYGAVVRAAPAGLEQLGLRDQVRVVDPAPEVRRLDRAVFLPPLPEQTEVVRPVRDGLSSVEGGSGGGVDHRLGRGGMAQIGFPP
ncbi:MAG TPA: hypothetical protein VFX61_11560 [Micromonosporaceae bacterium]|nr:hypothetical protein [Micromonosporaceae bacterium]